VDAVIHVSAKESHTNRAELFPKQ